MYLTKNIQCHYTEILSLRKLKYEKRIIAFSAIIFLHSRALCPPACKKSEGHRSSLHMKDQGKRLSAASFPIEGREYFSGFFQRFLLHLLVSINLMIHCKSCFCTIKFWGLRLPFGCRSGISRQAFPGSASATLPALRSGNGFAASPILSPCFSLTKFLRFHKITA